MKTGHFPALIILGQTALGTALQAADVNQGEGHCAGPAGLVHGPLPALAYRISVGDKNIVFSGDQDGNLEAFTEFAAKADVLVMHMPVPEKISGIARNLHAPPGIIGNIAALADAGTLVLNHFMARSLENLEENLAAVRSNYKGSILVSKDLECFDF